MTNASVPTTIRSTSAQVRLIEADWTGAMVGKRRCPGGTMNRIKESKNPYGVGGLLIRAVLIVFLGLLIAYDRRLAAVAVIVIFLTSGWAAVDSIRIELQTYRTWIALHPILLFNLMYLFWPVAFPWYLAVRSRIGQGSLARQTNSTGLRELQQPRTRPRK